MHITLEQVRRAIVQLVVEQKNPTQERIRHVLGGGSNSTIAKLRTQVLEEWRQGMEITLPPGLPGDVGELFVSLWVKCLDEAREQLSQEFAEAKKAMAEAVDAKEQASIEVSQLREQQRRTDLELAKTQSALQHAQETRQQLNDQVEYFKQQLSQSEKRLEDALVQQKHEIEERNRDETADLRVQLAEKSQLLESLEGQLKASEKARSADIESHAKQLDHFIVEVDRVRQDRSSEIEAKEGVIKRLEAELNISQSTVSQLRKQVDSLIDAVKNRKGGHDENTI